MNYIFVDPFPKKRWLSKIEYCPRCGNQFSTDDLGIVCYDCRIDDAKRQGHGYKIPRKQRK
ncbi:hypothetical protein GGF39_002593 [Coemansia sp. RSA 1721]|nr:hypothetical protein GGF39_002593 [Coemansia sp. RSA 1721]